MRLFYTAKKQAGANKYFFVKKMDIWHIRAPDGPKSGPIFFSRRTKILPAAKGPKKGPKSGRLGFRSKFGRLGASERQKTAVRRPKNSPKKIFRNGLFLSQKYTPPACRPTRATPHPSNRATLLRESKKSLCGLAMWNVREVFATFLFKKGAVILGGCCG